MSRILSEAKVAAFKDEVEAVRNCGHDTANGAPVDTLLNLLHSLTVARAALRKYDDAADKFIAKVESGRAQSHETYNDLLRCRQDSHAAFGEEQP